MFKLIAKEYLIFLLLFSLIPFKAYSQRDIPDNNLSYPVLITLADQSTASGFFLVTDTTFYFITARHVLFSQPKNILKSKEATLLFYSVTDTATGRFRIKLDLNNLFDENHIKYHKKHDVAMIHLANKKTDVNGIGKLVFFKQVDIQEKASLPIIGVHVSNCKTFSDVLISNEVIIFGYPRSLGIKNLPQLDYDRPLLRKGIVAGKNNKTKTIIIDCPVYGGNSGGPVIEIDRLKITQSSFKVIGIVSEFVPFAEKWLNVTHGYSNTEISNSGYSVVTTIDAVFELLANN